ncbi:MAG: dihydrofolate reductase [Deltaproteobacteria bacterium]|jgi:dihydrofolate reductase/thymidylate synthase|nr:dihydrofolate reductase [Deltaproteobacteria bacterium]MBW2530178.1 dihydrofolate reductase [Deltaproteobacteria bacterium]
MNATVQPFDVVVAVDEANGIARQGSIPWLLPGDRSAFRQRTVTAPPSAVLMGRLTWQSLPPQVRPLPDRLNVVLTRNGTLSFPEGVLSFDRLEGALAALRARSLTGSLARVFVIGGASVYRQAFALPHCRQVHLTRIEGSFDCDLHLPPLPASHSLLSRSEPLEEDGVRYAFETYGPASREG